MSESGEVDEIAEIDKALEELESGDDMKQSQSKIWKIFLTVAAVIFLILTGVFLYLWITVFTRNQAEIKTLNTCTDSVTKVQQQTEANNKSLDQCLTDNAEEAKTSLGIYTFDTRSFDTNPKVFLGVDKPNELNPDKTGVYPVLVQKRNAKDSEYQHRNLLDKGQYPGTDDVKPPNDQNTYLYSFSIKPKTASYGTAGGCPCWQVINRLDPSWNWDLKYRTSKYQTTNDVDYVLVQGVGSTIPGGQIINSGDVRETSTGRVSCIGLGSVCTLTLQHGTDTPVEYEFTAPNIDFVIIMFNPEGDLTTAIATLGFLF